MSANTLPEINRRLLEQRGAFADTATALRRRVKREIRSWEPRQLLRRHPEAAVGAAAVLGLVAGRIVGGVLGALLRS